jgi:hypothetical protein
VIDRFFVREVQIVPAVTSATADRYGSASVTFAAAGRTVMGWVSQTAAEEPQSDLRDPLVTSLVLFLPPDTAITGRDRVILDDVTYTVEGTPHRAWRPSGEHHLEVRLQEVTG